MVNLLKGVPARSLLLFCAAVALCVFLPEGFGQDNQVDGNGLIKIQPGAGLRQLHYRPAPGSTLGTAPLGTTTATSSSTTPLQTWTGTISSTADGSQAATTYTYTMVGQMPTPTAGTTVIPTVLIPVRLNFKYSRKAIYVFDPNVTDSGCLGSSTATALTQGSPLFNNYDYNLNGTDVGTTQYVDAFQRANFWTNPDGSPNVSSNPNYHTLLGTLSGAPGVSTLAEQSVTVTSSDFGNPNGAVYVASGTCGSNTGYTNHAGYFGVMNINYWDPVAQSLLTNLKIQPNTFAIFLFYNAVLSNGNPTNQNNCCILGYHNAFGTSSQTYAVAEFTEQNIFQGVQDITAMSHEVGEWMDDPLLTNKTPAWFNGTLTCQTLLEVGDPLDGTSFSPVTMNGFTYNPQELAFFSWFFDENPSRGVNGWFSNNGTFASDAHSFDILGLCP
jgi:hypothetical protein